MASSSPKRKQAERRHGSDVEDLQEGVMKRFGWHAAVTALALCTAAPAMADEDIGLVFERGFLPVPRVCARRAKRDLRWKGRSIRRDRV
jgi:hypothetical protein